MVEQSSRGMKQGEVIIGLLRNPKKLEGKVWHDHGDILLTDEEGSKEHWNYFVTFPSELSGSFPGSIIRPDTFLKELGENQKQSERLIGNTTGTKDIMTFHHKEEKLSLSILHGSTSGYALSLMKLARHGFGDDYVRAEYQQALAKGIEPVLKTEAGAYGVRIHDDCLASGDSILSYMELQIQQGNEEVLKKGVEVVIDGPATAQGILLLRAYSKKYNIPLNITAGYMAYGLTEGIKTKNGVKKHANYITMPEEVIRMLPKETQKEIYAQKGEDGNIQVVGDMGDAEKGINHEIMQQMREEKEDPTFCTWNDTRRDSHGNHLHKGELPPMNVPLDPDSPNDVYFARGGYLPYALDEQLNPLFQYTNKIITRASRKWTQEHGYGAAFREE